MRVLQLMLRYKGASTGFAFFLTLSSIYGAIAPNWNPIVEYCVPGSNCKVLKKIDSRIFEWNRQQTEANAKNHSTHNEWLIRANDIAAATGLTITQAQNTLSPASTKEFIALTADARGHGWLVQGIQDYPGWGVVRKVMGAIALASSLGSIWLLSQIEEELPEHETRLARAGSTATEKILAWYELNEGAYSLAQCEQMYADGTIAHIEGQLAILDQQDSRNQQKLLSGSTTLDSVINPGDKVEAAEEVQAIAPKPVVESQTLSPEGLPVVRSNGSNDEGLRILDAIVGTTRSTVIAAATGTGKSVSEAYILTKFFQRFPHAEVWVISQKNDSFNGLDKKGKVNLFDPTNPEESFEPLSRVWDIFDQRRRVPEGDRAQFKEKPVRLILSDWHSVFDCCRDEKWFQPCLKKLSTIVTVGRELNVCLIVDTQSFNIGALGLAPDTNIRRNLNILSLGFTWVDSEGMTQGDYGVLQNIIGSHHVINEADLRAGLSGQFKALKEESQRVGVPIIFTSIEPPRLALLPDIRHYKPGQEPRVKLEGYSPEQLNRILSLEFDIDQSDQESVKETQLQLSSLQKKILKYLLGKDAKTPRQIKQNTGEVFNRIGEPEIKSALDDLVTKSIASVEGELYRIK